MYCTNCGKKIDYDAPLCDECRGRIARESAEAESVSFEATVAVESVESEAMTEESEAAEESAATSEATDYTVESVARETVDPNYCDSRMKGFGMGLTSAILGFISYIWFFVSFFMIIGNLEYDPGAAIVSSLLLTFMGAPAVVLSIVFGIKSISLFKKSTGKRPIPALALGIGGVVLSGIGAFFMLIMLLVSMAAF